LARSKTHPFKGRQFTAEVILWAVRWYLQFPLRYRDLHPWSAPAPPQISAFIYQLANPSEGGRNREVGNNGWWPTGLVRSVSCARSMR
jgi:hypothetical protein